MIFWIKIKLSAKQSGFRTEHSCGSALNLVISNWKDEIQHNKVIVAVFLDLKRAFETVDRILVKKLKAIGIRGVALAWFTSYLENRLQFTRYQKTKTNELPNCLGVPQGSVLGPILFIIYINDIENAVTSSTMNLFADDPLVSVADSDFQQAMEKINSDLDGLNRWLQMNKLKLNISKTKCMCITFKKNIDFLNHSGENRQ